MAETGMQWYVLRAITGKEGKVKEYLEAEIKNNTLPHVQQVLIPMEKKVTVSNGKRVVKEHNLMSGYVLVQAEMIGEVALTLRNTPNVVGILGGIEKPAPLRQSEINRLLGTVEELIEEDGEIPYMEGEPVSRHLGKLKKTTDKPCYCLFIAPSINEACVAHFFALHQMNISYYGGKSVIIPLPLEVFRKMVDDSYRASYIPKSSQVKRLFEYSEKIASQCTSEAEWYDKVQQKAIFFKRQFCKKD